MKKVLALALALIMMFALAIPAMAEDGDETEAPAATTNTSSKDFTNETAGNVGTSKVEYGVSQSYTVTIPNVVTFASSLKNVEATVSVADAFLAGNEKVNVKVTSAKEYELKDASKVTKTAWTMVDTNGISTPVDYWLGLAANTAESAKVADAGIVLTVERAVGNAGVVGASGSQTLYFNTDGTAQEGTYEDRLTFDVEITTNATGHTYTPVVAG